ncbi:DUF1642 domain-containing protein [Lactococcus lactis]|uniref:DUF1642 domain-containing protein n=1 Tax=Lactococcus lactis TaxID=1358 RepID=UPI001CC2B12E|nr:DUF1642 domain-containing protein [Lactococcus lactis]
MTKFEEEVKRPKKAYIDPFSKRDVDFTGVAKKFTEGAQTLKEWKEYAFLLEDKLKLQQQSLPVVPEDVDKAIKYLKTQNNFATLSDLGDILTEKGFWWLNDFQFKDRRFGFGGLNNKLFILSHLAITGYTVEKPQLEKPQLFYIDLPKVFGLSDSTSDSTFVSKAESGIISEFTKGKDYALKLTEQEIKSIDERYWQFAVPVEDGE